MGLSKATPLLEQEWKQALSLQIMVDPDCTLLFPLENFAHSLEQKLQPNLLTQLMELDGLDVQIV